MLNKNGPGSQPKLITHQSQCIDAELGCATDIEPIGILLQFFLYQEYRKQMGHKIMTTKLRRGVNRPD